VVEEELSLRQQFGSTNTTVLAIHG